MIDINIAYSYRWWEHFQRGWGGGELINLTYMITITTMGLRLNDVFFLKKFPTVNIYSYLYTSVTVSITYMYTADAIGNISSNYTIGFGSFVEKPLGPYTSLNPDEQNNPCAGQTAFSQCVPTYSYKHAISLTPNATFFSVSHFENDKEMIVGGKKILYMHGCKFLRDPIFAVFAVDW